MEESVRPEDLIALDLLVYREGTEFEQYLWEKFKKELKRLAHKEAGVT